MKRYMKTLAAMGKDSLVDGGMLYGGKTALDGTYALLVRATGGPRSFMAGDGFVAKLVKPALALGVGSALVEFTKNKWAHLFGEGMVLASVYELFTDLADPWVVGTPQNPGPLLKLTGFQATSGRVTESRGRVIDDTKGRFNLNPMIDPMRGNFTGLPRMGSAGILSMMG